MSAVLHPRAEPRTPGAPVPPLVALPADPPDADPRPVPRPTARAAEAGHSPFVPLLLLAVAVVGWTGFQTAQLARERARLGAARDAQQAQVDAAVRVRANLDALAASTQRLANAGNANARRVVAALRARGVDINPDPVAVAPPAAP